MHACNFHGLPYYTLNESSLNLSRGAMKDTDDELIGPSKLEDIT